MVLGLDPGPFAVIACHPPRHEVQAIDWVITALGIMGHALNHTITNHPTLCKLYWSFCCVPVWLCYHPVLWTNFNWLWLWKHSYIAQYSLLFCIILNYIIKNAINILFYNSYFQNHYWCCKDLKSGQPWGWVKTQPLLHTVRLRPAGHDTYQRSLFGGLRGQVHRFSLQSLKHAEHVDG